MTPSFQSLWRSWVIIGSLVGLLAIVAWKSGGFNKVGQAFTSSSSLLLSVLPNLILGFLLAGFLNVLVPSAVVSKWMGQDSGILGLGVGTLAGMLTPGGPFTHFPILASFLAKGAAVGPICAYIAAWSLIGLNRFFVWELPILGYKVASARFLASMVFPPLIGWFAGLLYRILHKMP